MSIEVLYEDRSIIVIYKPAGLATQTANVRQPDCVSLIKEHIRAESPGNKKEPYVGIVHRLDQPVAGILVFAKDSKAASSLSRQVQSSVMNKNYLAMVEGILDVPEETEITDRLYKDGKAGKAIVADQAPSGIRIQEASLTYRTKQILEEENKTILSVRLITGRFHQIRAQLSHLGNPIVGDVKYGAKTSYPSGIALVANRLEFVHPATGEKVEKVVDFSFCL